MVDKSAEQTHDVTIDVERQQQAREYSGIQRRIGLVNMAIAAVCLLFIFWTGFDIGLRDMLGSLNWQPLRGWYPLQVLAYVIVLLLAYRIISTPLSYYSSFVLSHRYGLSTMSLKKWVIDRLKGLVLELILEIGSIEIIYVLLATQPQIWWLLVAGIFLLFSVIMANLAPILLFPIFYKFTPLPEGELTERLMKLANRARTKVQGVFTMHLSDRTTAANAALMGLGNTRRIVIGDTMLDRYTPDEIEVVLAHELGHHVHHDIWKLIISQSIITIAALYLVNVVLHWAVDTQQYYQGLADPATLPLILLLVAVFGLIAMPISNSYTRRIEYQADEYALQSTQMIEPFKNAMTRLANQNLAEIEPSPIIEVLFHDHPSIGKRLKHADAFATRYDFKASMSAPS